MNPVVDAELASFIQGPVMIVLAASGAAGRPAIGRAVGLRLSADRALVDVLVSRGQWPDLLEGQGAGSPWALTVSDPVDYRTFQIKGRLTEVAAGGSDDHGLADRYIAAMTDALAELGVHQGQSRFWFSTQDLARVRLIPMTVFWQTPGARAGDAMAPRQEGRP